MVFEIERVRRSRSFPLKAGTRLTPREDQSHAPRTSPVLQPEISTQVAMDADRVTRLVVILPLIFLPMPLKPVSDQGGCDSTPRAKCLYSRKGVFDTLAIHDRNR